MTLGKVGTVKQLDHSEIISLQQLALVVGGASHVLLFLCVVLFVLESSIVPALLLGIDLRRMGLELEAISRTVIKA